MRCLSQSNDGHYGQHAAVCPVSGDTIKIHHALCDCLYEFCLNAAWGPIKEKPFLLPYSPERPDGIFIPNFSAGKGLVVDFACTCPNQQNYDCQASQTLAFACNQYAQVFKYDRYQDRVISEGHSYLPFVLQSFGGTSGDSHEFTKKG